MPVNQFLPFSEECQPLSRFSLIFPYPSPAPEEGKKRDPETIIHPEILDIKCMVTYSKTPQRVPLLKNKYEQPAGWYNFKVWGIFKF